MNSGRTPLMHADLFDRVNAAMWLSHHRRVEAVNIFTRVTAAELAGKRR